MIWWPKRAKIVFLSELVINQNKEIKIPVKILGFFPRRVQFGLQIIKLAHIDTRFCVNKFNSARFVILEVTKSEIELDFMSPL